MADLFGYLGRNVFMGEFLLALILLLLLLAIFLTGWKVNKSISKNQKKGDNDV